MVAATNDNILMLLLDVVPTVKDAQRYSVRQTPPATVLCNKFAFFGVYWQSQRNRRLVRRSFSTLAYRT